MAYFRDPWDAHLFRTRLEADGIPAFVADDRLAGVRWDLSGALGGVRVQVPDSCAESAFATKANVFIGAALNDLESAFGDVARLCCPRCASTDIRRRPSLAQAVLVIAALALTGVIFKPPTRRCRCRVCGARWRDRRYA